MSPPAIANVAGLLALLAQLRLKATVSCHRFALDIWPRIQATIGFLYFRVANKSPNRDTRQFSVLDIK